MVGQQLEGAGALAGDDRRVVVGVDEGPALVLGEPQRLGRRPRRCPRRQHDPGAQLPGALHLHERRVGRHDDGGVDAEPGGVVGDGLGVVAGRHGHDARGPLAVVEREQLVERAPLLERRRRTGGSRTSRPPWQPERPADSVREWALGVRSTAPAMRLGGRHDVVEGDRQVSRVMGGRSHGSRVASASPARSVSWSMVMSSRASGQGSTPGPARWARSWCHPGRRTAP